LKLKYLTKNSKRTAKKRDIIYKLDNLFQGGGYPGLIKEGNYKLNTNNSNFIKNILL